MAKNKRRMAQNRASKIARMAARKKRTKAPSEGGRLARIGCTRGELGRSSVYGAYVGDTVFTEGIGNVIIARVLPDGRIVAGVFLVDAYCLGVKNAFMMVEPRVEFDAIIETQFDVTGLKPVKPACARKLVDDAIVYARDLGFEPHRDFRDASAVLGDIDPTECDQTFTFGKDGKPFYVSGPNDSDVMIRRVTTQLRNRCGLDGAHFMVHLNDPAKGEKLGLKGRIISADGDEPTLPGKVHDPLN